MSSKRLTPKRSRRRFLSIALTSVTLGGVALLAACGGPATVPPQPQRTPPTPSSLPPTPNTPRPSPVSSLASPTNGKLKEVPRNKTLIVVRGGTQGKHTDHLIWNPFLPQGNHQLGSQLLYEPLAFYSAFADKTTMWLAESYAYSKDFMQLTVKTRSGVTWSDGQPFSAEDVAYTFTQLAQLGPKVKWGADVQQFLDTARATDRDTAVFTFKVPAPRFFDFIAYKFDIGVYIVPKHIFFDQDWTTFTHFDLAKGWPVTTGPWRVVEAAPEQKILDRATSWWGEKLGIAKLPRVERYVYLPDPGEQGLATGIMNSEYDLTTGIQPTTFPTVFKGNPRVITWTGQKAPFGQVDWWPHSLYLNNEKAPWSDPDVRWAISYYLDRTQIIDVAWAGASSPSTLFLPDYPGLKPFIDAVSPQLHKYTYLEFNIGKGDDLLTKKGWKKVNGIWHDAAGQPVTLEIISFFDFTSVGPVIVEQLRRAGIDASYAEPPDMFSRFGSGAFSGALFGHGGSYSADVYYSLRLYQTASAKIPGGHLVNFSRWKNDAYDKLVDQLYGISPTDAAAVRDIWKQCMNLWLPAYPDIQISQGLHRLPMNTTYWKGWPDEQNPYINPAHFHLTFALVLHALEPAG